MLISYFLKKQYPASFAAQQNSWVPHHHQWLMLSENQNVEIWTPPLKNDARFNTRALALLLGTWHRSLIFCWGFADGLTESPWSDWSTRFSLTNLIGWLFSNVTGVWGSFVWVFKSVKVGQKSFFEWAVLDAPVLGQFLSDFDRLKSNVSPRLSTF